MAKTSSLFGFVPWQVIDSGGDGGGGGGGTENEVEAEKANVIDHETEVETAGNTNTCAALTGTNGYDNTICAMGRTLPTFPVFLMRGYCVLGPR